jgi:hypothetical protein
MFVSKKGHACAKGIGAASLRRRVHKSDRPSHLQDVQRPGHLSEDEHTVSGRLQFGQEHVQEKQLAAGLQG